MVELHSKAHGGFTPLDQGVVEPSQQSLLVCQQRQIKPAIQACPHALGDEPGVADDVVELTASTGYPGYSLQVIEAAENELSISNRATAWTAGLTVASHLTLRFAGIRRGPE